MHTRPITEAQLAANRANATHSTGPNTEQGKRIASHNALKTGLTGRTVLLPSDDDARYQDHCNRVLATHKPATDEERTHVDTIADLEWRLLRVATLESGIFALGRYRLAEQFESAPAANQATLVDAEVYVVYRKELTNLYLQESRIVRRLHLELTQLGALQQQRLAKEKAQLEEAAAYYRDCIERDIPYHHNVLTEAGFEFSILDVQRALAARQSRETRSKWPTIETVQLLKAFPATQLR